MSDRWKWLEEIKAHKGRIDYVQLYRLIACIEEMKEALEFYSDEEMLKVPYDDSGRGPEYHEDEGKLAREALAKCAEGKFE